MSNPNPQYWQNFGEYLKSTGSQIMNKNEFLEDLPVGPPQSGSAYVPGAKRQGLGQHFKEEKLMEDLEDENLLNAKTPRRDFLKYMGFSTAAAVVAASCEMPVHRAIPYLNKPDDITPGIANYYASTYINDGDAVPVVVKQREGRPIKIEGNDLSSLTRGGTSAQCQASVLDLYDTKRLRYPVINKKEATFEAVDKGIADGLASVGTAPLVLLTSSISSPTTNKIIGEFLTKYPNSKHVVYDAVSYSGMLTANEASYGKKAIPAYRFDKAKVIVSLGADFLGTWLSPVVFANQYAEARRITGLNPTMSRHIQFDSFMSMTAANADEKYLYKPSELGSIALALLGALGGSTSANLPDNLATGVKKTAAELSSNKGNALVVCSSNDPNIQTIVNAINEAIGANGNTIDWNHPVNYRQGIDSEFEQLVSDLTAGNVGGLFVYGANPVYSYFDAKKLRDAIKKVKLSVSYNDRLDETTELCKYVIPANNWLESWGDAEIQKDYFSVIQPLIHPLFKTRQFEDSILKLNGNPDDYVTYFRKYWIDKLGGLDNYNKFLQDGVVEDGKLKTSSKMMNVDDLESGTATGLASFSNSANSSSDNTSGAVALGSASFTGNVADAAAKISAVKAGGDVEFLLYQNVAMRTGNKAANPWLEELSDPITKCTWDNYAVVSPEMGKKLFNIDIWNPRDADKYEVHPEKPLAKISINGKDMEIPVLIIPGTHPNVVAMAVGYGRESEDPKNTGEYIGNSAVGVGKNVYPFTSYANGFVSYNTSGTIADTGKQFKLALSQTHNISEGRPVIREQNLDDFKKDPAKLNREQEEELAQYGKNFTRDATMYPTYEKPGIKWGMSIDLSACIGCMACVIACQAENNISVVGKDEVARYHDMQWIRIDRYYSGDPKNPDVTFQPMLCQHCDNAPCENVCPVNATSHSSEGLNQMIYNRCIGTKYCMNNCPYKVRRFNWFDWNGSDSFPDNQKGIISDPTMDLNADLSRMVLNPDVTVRARGVMEKCTFCVQRLQEGKLNAKKENRPLKDQEVKTACMQACPTGAINFGNVNDPTSQVYSIRHNEDDNKNRKFYSLEQLHTLSNVNYLTKIRNTNRDIEPLKSELKTYE